MEQKRKEADERIGQLLMRNAATQNMLHDTSSVLHCQSCHKRLSLARCIYHAFGKEQGERYEVRCRCGHTNIIKKGQAGDDIDAAWCNNK